MIEMEYAAAILFLILYFVRLHDWVPMLSGLNVIKPVIGLSILGLLTRPPRVPKWGWMKTPQGEQPLAGPMAGQIKQQLFAELFNLLRSNQVAGRTVNYAGEGTIEVAEGQLMAKLVVDEATGMPKMSVMQVISPQGPVLIETSYSDFREIGGGLKFPFKSIVTQGGKQVSDATVSEMKANTGLTAEELSKKP